METPLVSIIIPAYNAKAFIEETIKSVLNQTYNEIEIIIIDDGSTDQTETLFSQKKNSKTQYYKIQNSGASAARNFGLSKAKGEYIQFLDADDILNKEKIEKQVSMMQKEGALLSFSLWNTFEKNNITNRPFKFKHIDYLSLKDGAAILTSFGLDDWYIPVFSWLTHKSLIDKAGLWNETISNNDDAEFFTRILINAIKVAAVNEILGHYRILSTDSLSKLNTKSKIDSIYNSCLLIEKHLKQSNNTAVLAYPKRLFYYQYKWIGKDFKAEAQRAAKRFDALKVDCFLKKQKQLWISVNLFGLIKGEYLEYLLNRIQKRLGLNN